MLEELGKEEDFIKHLDFIAGMIREGIPLFVEKGTQIFSEESENKNNLALSGKTKKRRRKSHYKFVINNKQKKIMFQQRHYDNEIPDRNLQIIPKNSIKNIFNAFVKFCEFHVTEDFLEFIQNKRQVMPNLNPFSNQYKLPLIDSKESLPIQNQQPLQQNSQQQSSEQNEISSSSQYKCFSVEYNSNQCEKGQSIANTPKFAQQKQSISLLQILRRELYITQQSCYNSQLILMISQQLPFLKKLFIYWCQNIAPFAIQKLSAISKQLIKFYRNAIPIIQKALIKKQRPKFITRYYSQFPPAFTPRQYITHIRNNKPQLLLQPQQLLPELLEQLQLLQQPSTIKLIQVLNIPQYSHQYQADISSIFKDLSPQQYPRNSLLNMSIRSQNQWKPVGETHVDENNLIQRCIYFQESEQYHEYF